MRSARIAVVVAAALVLPAAARAEDPDPWFGKDKALHFGVSTGLAMTGYGVGILKLPTRGEALLFGGGLSFGLGIAKETYDLTGRGDPSWKDLTWDAIGTAAGLAIAWGLDQLLR